MPKNIDKIPINIFSIKQDDVIVFSISLKWSKHQIVFLTFKKYQWNIVKEEKKNTITTSENIINPEISEVMLKFCNFG